ncbi:MAG TPA: efflux RND transporter permease subunit [Candidatus Baltobacteraceae bacterium]|nr:efflux RND transporter permease subunit [Candidatus Baltobacteraceae bacterium]
MNLTKLFLERPPLVFVLVSVMIVAGVISLTTIVKELFPNVSQPTITISADYNGASVTEMRDNIVAPIEEKLAGTTDLQDINSVVQQGQAQISATYTITSSEATDLALTEKAVQAAETELPSNMQVPTVNIRDPAEETVVTLAMYSSKLTPGELALYANNVVVPQIQQIPGIAYASVGGAVTPAYEVEVDPAKLAARNLTINDVINTLNQQNSRVPGGYAYQPGRQTIIDVRGDIQTIQQVKDLPIIASGPAAASNQTAGQVNAYNGGVSSLPGGVNPWTASNQVTRIGEVANVVEGNEPQLQYARINGERGFFLSIQKTADASEVDASNNFMKQLPDIEREFPAIHFEIVNIASRFTQQQMDAVLHTLLEAIFLTAVAMLFFLRSWRSAIVVCIAIPTSLAIALTVMRMTGMTIDTISMLAMTLVIGILVDDSTVVLENIERHFRDLKQNPKDAAYEGRMEIGAAAVVITLVDVVVFLPIAFISGQVGRFLVEFALIIVISTLTSLFISFTVTPTLAGLWALQSHWKPWRIVDAFGRGFDKLREWYAHRALAWALKHRTVVVVGCMLSFVLALALVQTGLVGENFIPPVDRGEIYIQMQYPEGTPISAVRAGAYKLEAFIDKTSDLQHETTVAGAYSASFGGFVVQPDVAQIHVFLNDNHKYPTDYWVAQYQRALHRILPTVTASVVPASSTHGGNAQPIDFLVSDLTGGDPTPYAQRVLALLKSTPGATSVNSSAQELAPEISVTFNRQKAEALDVDLGQAASAAGAAFGGNVATQFETPSGLEQVQVIYPLADQSSLGTLSALPIRANNGQIVHLSDIAAFSLTPTPPFITRTNRLTVIHVDANVAPGTSLSNVESAFEKRLPSLHFPPNVVVRPAPMGQQDFMHQILLGMGISMILSVILVFLLMVALYNSYSSPFIILFSVPVAAVGAIGALLITHETLNLFSLIGTILLIGIATKNGILLVDYANTLRARGRNKLAAIKESAFTRFRPIVMTSCSIIAAMFPLALALEPGTASHSSLGVVVIGGVASSLVLTLLLIPIVYLWFAPDKVTVSNAPPESAEPSQPLEPVPVTSLPPYS